MKETASRIISNKANSRVNQLSVQFTLLSGPCFPFLSFFSSRRKASKHFIFFLLSFLTQLIIQSISQAFLSSPGVTNWIRTEKFVI